METLVSPDLITSSFQIHITLLSRKTMILWVCSSDVVKNLSHDLELKLAIPTALRRFLYGGKQLEDYFPLSFYNIEKDATVILTLRLRGGEVGHPSSAHAFSYKDVVHAQPPKKATQPSEAPKPFLVDKLEEVPSVEISHPVIDDQLQMYVESAFIF